LSENGLTLIEIILAFAILSIVLVAYLTLFTDASRDNSSTLYKSKAVYVAQSYMEKIYAGGTEHSYDSFRTILTTDDPDYGFVWDSANEEYHKTESNYYIKIKINSKTGNLYKVLVQIYNNSQAELLAQNESAFIFKE
jgi:prepilin-type N-terminal cleavage/methylation domain-containing protein